MLPAMTGGQLDIAPITPTQEHRPGGSCDLIPFGVN